MVVGLFGSPNVSLSGQEEEGGGQNWIKFAPRSMLLNDSLEGIRKKIKASTIRSRKSSLKTVNTVRLQAVDLSTIQF